jgi:hypothetical protein
MKVKPRKLKVSGLPSPRFSRFTAAWRPNSIRRVFSGWNARANVSNRVGLVARIGHLAARDEGIGGWARS